MFNTLTETQAVWLSQMVLVLGFVLTFALGFLAQSTHFCTMGAVIDVFSYGSWTRACQVLVAMGVSMVGFAVFCAYGWVDPLKTLYATDRLYWLSDALGGALFGVGMVLASGCGNKTLVRMGTGNLKSWVVFLFMGFAALATLKGITAVVRVNWLDTAFVKINGGVDLAHFMFGPRLSTITYSLMRFANAEWILLGCGVGVMVIMVAWIMSLLTAPHERELKRLRSFLPGVGVGLLITLAWGLSGYVGHVSEHPVTLEEAFLASSSGRIEALSFVAPMAYLIDWLIYFSDQSKFLNYGAVCALGVIAGSFVSACLNGSLRWEGFGSPSDLGLHIIGAILMGVGGVLAMGCTFGQGISSLSTLSINAMEVVIFIVLGAWMGFKIQLRALD